MTQDDLILREVMRLIEDDNTDILVDYLEELHPTDIANLFKDLPEGNREFIFNCLVSEKAVQVLEELEHDLRLYFLNNVPRNYMTRLLKEMSSDEIADFSRELPDELAERLLGMLAVGERSEIENLLEYDKSTAGGLMTTEYVAFHLDTSIKKVLDKLPDVAPDAETIYYIYVVDNENKIKGVISLRDLILAEPNLPLKEVMLTDVIRIDAGMDQEEVAKVFEKYGLLGMPVVDHDNTLLGIITVDDVFDIIEEEATEDILKLAGADVQLDVEDKSAWYRAYRRLPWLLIALVGQIFSGKVVSGFSETLEAVIALSFFIPVLMDMGGNVGTQSSAIIVRGLATDNIDTQKSIRDDIARESAVGLLLGAVSGIATALIAYVWQGIPMLGLVVGLSMTLTLTVAAALGAFVPLALNKIGKDPAVSSGPFVTTVLDVVGLLIYFGSASLFVGHLL
ncbi:MAG TPA: magnesium transporter [Firmicutes bacterium]|jgi:magnesium transporter|nr:magnesium transporter [Bacillota bacterium]